MHIRSYRFYFVLSAISFHCFLFSQSENNRWYFGQNAGLDFNLTPPAPLTNGVSQSFNFPISVSDSLGNILFYTDNYKIYNRNHTMMPNGFGLGSNSSVRNQPQFVVKKLTEDSVYYLFTIDEYPSPLNPDPFGLRYSVIDLRLDNGFGDIVPTQKNIQVPDAEKTAFAVTGIRHANNHYAWIIARHYFFSHNYLSYLIDSNGININPVLSTSFLELNPSYEANKIAFIRVSPDGQKLVALYDTVAELCQFNASNGIITPLFCFKTALYPFTILEVESCEFSLDSRKLYINFTADPGMICQFDATRTDSAQFVQSETFIANTYTYTGLNRGPDGKIYCTVPNKDSLDVIHNPTLQGNACDFERNAIWLNGKISYYGLPQYLQRYYLYIHSTGRCINDSIEFSMTVWPPSDSISWNFGDPGSGAANISQIENPLHLFTAPGYYTITLIVLHNDKRFDTATCVIQIKEGPQPDLGPDQSTCLGDSITLDAGACVGCSYQWDNVTIGQFNIGNEQTYTAHDPGNYRVTVTNSFFCSGQDTIELSFTSPPIITNNPLIKLICSGESTGIPLESNLPGTTFEWTAVSSSLLVTGYGPGTGDTIDQVLINTSASSETVTYTITPTLGDCHGDSVEYVVTVTPGDSVLISISASDDSICQGTQISYMATPTHGGSAPSYQWKVNGVNQGTNNSVFNYTPSNHDTVCCILTSSDTVCISNNPATSNEIIMTIYPNLPVLISIFTTNNPICAGNTATFIASTSNKGTSPNFQWIVNGNPVGTNDSSYTYTPSDGDQVICILTSGEQCTSNNPATSDTIKMIVNPLLLVGISISASANPVCEGLPITFSSIPINGGSSPIYQWQVNGINTGANNPNFTYNPANGDLLTCTLTSNTECIINNPATSNSITMSVGEAPDVSFPVCFDTVTTLDAKPFKLKGGIPLGGTYSGPGVDQITGYFNPAMAGVGLKTISYSYTNLFNCSNNAIRAISVINPASLACGDSLTDIRDYRKYPTIQIGSQCWLALNLNYGQQISGSSAQRDNCLVEKYCYNNLNANCSQFGALYQWDELMRYEDTEEIQGLCPPGWHIPSESDWSQLFAVYQGNAFAGSPLLYTGYSGFNVLLAGVEFFNQSHRFVDFASIMWSSTSHGPYKAWSHGLNEYNYSVSYYPSYRSNAFSVRCVRD